MLKKFFYIFFGLLIFFLVNFLNFSVHENVFNSADEAANYQITKQYGTNWILYLTWDHLNIDKWNNLHMRGFITYNNKLVPFNFLWLPLFYWPFYAILWENIKYINIFLMIIIVFVLLKTFTNLFNIRGKDTIILSSIFGLLVMVYYISHPYFNIVPFLPFFFLFLYYIFKFQKT